MAGSKGVLRIVDPDNPGQCCPCSRQDGCSCGSDSCSVRCRTRAGTASLCGFSEFGTPSTPPKLYRKFRIHSLAPFKVCSLPDPDCVAPTCPLNFSCDFIGGIPGIPFLVEFHGKWTYQGIVAGLAQYKSTVTATLDGVPAGSAMSAGPATGPGGGSFADGAVTAFTPGVIVGVAGSVTYVTANPIPGCAGCVKAGVSAVVVLNDTWDITNQYVRDPDDPCSAECILEESDVSSRDTASGDSCAASGGTVGPIGASTPEGAYGLGNVTDTIVSGVEIMTSGNGCVTPMGVSPSVDFAGDVSQLLSDEDSDQDAIDRATICTPWGPTEGCTPEDGGTAFITPRTTGTSFGFRECQVRGTANDLVIGNNYRITIGISKRIYGTSGPFIPDSIIEINFTATSSPETTDWMLIPNEEGFESKAASCLLESV